MIWARHSSASRWCAVLRVGGGSVISHCNGRFDMNDPYERESAPRHEERCGRCVELTRRAMMSPVMVSSDWDLGEL